MTEVPPAIGPAGGETLVTVGVAGVVVAGATATTTLAVRAHASYHRA